MNFTRIAPLALAAATLATPAAAYVGPGLGLGALGVVLGLVLSVLLAVVALVWYPVKRMIKGRKAPAESETSDIQPAE